MVHVHFLAFAEAVQEAGFPTFCTSHSLLSTDLAYTRGAFDGQRSAGTNAEIENVKKAEQSAYRHVHNVSVVSEFHKEELRAHYDRRNTILLSPPLSLEPFLLDMAQEVARERRYIRHRFTITFIGRPDRRKGVEVLITHVALCALRVMISNC